MKNKIIGLVLTGVLSFGLLTGCRESERVSYNVS